MATAAALSVEGLVKKLISDNFVMIFSKSFCPFCNAAKSIFNARNTEYLAVELDMRPDGPEIQNELLKLTGQSTVPNIFIGGDHIGGCDSLKEAEKSGQLVELLKQKSD